jgi:hypothetical protein
MKDKIINIIAVVICCAGFFTLGWFLNKPEKIFEDKITYGPDFNQDQPYLPFIYDQCPISNIPDEQSCATNLFYSMQKEADTLADNLLQSSPEPLRTNIQSAQQLRDDYIKAYCEIDGTKISGGTGEAREISACLYYHEKQYLELLKSIEKITTK